MSRRDCFWCGHTAGMRCKTHGKAICNHRTCLAWHRWGHTGRCVLVPRLTWFDYMVRAAAVFTIAIVVLVAFVHMGGSQ